MTNAAGGRKVSFRYLIYRDGAWVQAGVARVLAGQAVAIITRNSNRVQVRYANDTGSISAATAAAGSRTC